MRVRPIVTTVQSALAQQASMASDDPAIEAASSQLIDALEAAMRLAVMELAEQAAAEIAAQLPEHTVDVILVDGEPSLRLTDKRAAPGSAATSTEDFDARITLRLPPSLKQLIEESATGQGDSVNAWVVDALSSRAKRGDRRGRQVTDSFDL